VQGAYSAARIPSDIGFASGEPSWRQD